MGTETEDPVVIAPQVQVKETRPLVDRFSFTFGTIDQVRSDALICPQAGTFSGQATLERSLLEGAYGSEPFVEAAELESDYKESLHRIGERGDFRLPIGYARATSVGENELRVREIVSVNIGSEEDQTPERIRRSVFNSLSEASLNPEIKTAAVPAIGSANPETLIKNIPAIHEAIKDHFELSPTPLEKVLLVVNAEDNEENRRRIEELLSPEK